MNALFKKLFHPIKNNIIVIVLFLMTSLFAVSKYKPSILSWDTFGYYLYLPAKFIYHDAGIKNYNQFESLIEKYNASSTFYQVVRHENGNYIIKYSSGLAIVFTPFFFISHYLAGTLGYEQDGLSPPYQAGVFISSLLCILLGLFFSHKTLRHIYNKRTADIVLVLLVLGTNIFVIFTALTSIHLYLFSFYSVLIWLTLSWHEDPAKWKAALIGFFVGLITVIRPSEIICILIPVLWEVSNLHSLRRKWILISTHPWNMFLALLSGLLIVFPQLLYWKTFTGEWIFYSYVNPGEGFDFTTPYIMQVLFSFRKGWLIYTPLMFFAIAGFVFLYRKQVRFFLPLIVFFILNLFIVSSWTCWWYAGSFGQRALIQSYSIMLLPLGAITDAFLSGKKLYRNMFFPVLFCLIFLNLFQSWQYFNNIIDPMRMTRPYYFAVFGNTKQPDEKTKQLLLVERSFTAEDEFRNKENYFLKETDTLKFDALLDVPFERFTSPDSTQRLCLSLDSTYIFSPAFRKSYKELTKADHLFAIIKTKVYPINSEKDNPFSLVVSFEHKGGNYKYRTIDSEKIKDGLKVHEWNTLEFVYMTPEIRNSKDNIAVYFWLRGKQKLIIDDITIEFWEPKRGW